MVASHSGLDHAICKLPQKKESYRPKDDNAYWQSARSWASVNGHKSVAEVILECASGFKVLLIGSSVVNWGDWNG